jgi:hypothetical protein
MQLLLVLDSETTYDLIGLYVKPLGFELVRYRHPLKAMDNIDEVAPSGIILSARDFPRHWKSLVQFVRSERPKESCPIILLKGENFSPEETSKAFFLGVNGIVKEALNSPWEIDRLQNILGRYVPIEEKRRSRRYHAEGWNRFGFIVSHPRDGVLISGEVKTVSGTGISFYPNHPGLINGAAFREEPVECSLRAGEAILSPVCRLIRPGRIASFEFLSFPGAEGAALEAYLEGLPLQELRSKRRNHSGEPRGHKFFQGPLP